MPDPTAWPDPSIVSSPYNAVVGAFPTPSIDPFSAIATAPPQQPSASSQPQPSTAFSDPTGTMRSIAAQEVPMQKELLGNEARMERDEEERQKNFTEMMRQRIRQEGVTMADTRPWNAQAELQARQTSPWEAFGSPGFIVAMLASAFTAQPMNSALQSGAAAINAINQGKMKDYDKSFEAWKANTDLALKRMNMEHEEFQDIATLSKTSMEQFHSALTTMLAKNGDERKLLLLQNGFDDQVVKSFEGLANAIPKLEQARNDIETNDLRRRLVNEYLGDKKDTQSIVQATRKADAVMAAITDTGTPEHQMWSDFISKHPDASTNSKLDMLRRVTEASRSFSLSGLQEQMIVNKANEIRAADPNKSETDALIEASQQVKATAKGGAGMAADVPAIKADLAKNLGRPLTQPVISALDAAYGAKGQAAQRVFTSTNEAISQIESRIASGEKLSDSDVASIINNSARTAAMPAGRGALPLFMQLVMAKYPDLSPSQIMGLGALWTETQRMASTLGNATGTITRASKELDFIGPLALRASEANARSDIRLLNDIKRAFNMAESSKPQAVFNQLNQAMATAYGQVIGRGDTRTTDLRTRLANDQLNTDFGTGAYKSLVEIMIVEGQTVQAALSSAKEDLYGPEALDKRLAPYVGNGTGDGWKVEPKQ